MADTARKSTRSIAAAGGRQHQPSRLQRCRPATLQIAPAPAASAFWKTAAIPILSPLDSSPAAATAEMKLRLEEIPPPPQQQQQQRNQEAEKPLVFKKWQHPAAPFCFEAVPIAPSFFVPV